MLRPHSKGERGPTERHAGSDQLGCVWLDAQGGMERACHIFYTVWMGVTWGRGEPQRIFWWQRCPPKTNGWIRPRPSRGRKNRLAFHPYPIPSQPYLGGGAGAGERPSSRAGSRGRPSVQAQASGRPSRRPSKRTAAVCPSELVQPSRRCTLFSWCRLMYLIQFVCS